MKIELLPRGEFELTIPTGEKIKGKLGTWSFNRFCKRQNISLADLGQFIEKITGEDAVMLLLSAIEYGFIKEGRTCPYSDITVCDWIDQDGGIASFGSGWLTQLLEHSFPKEAVDDEKKNQQEPPHGEILSRPVTPPALNQTSTLDVL